MTESKLNPFDAELLVMIGDIAKSQPEVEEKPDRYEITVDTTEIQGNAIEALKQAVAGRLGKRLSRARLCGMRIATIARFGGFARSIRSRRRSTSQRRCEQWRNFSARCSPVPK